MQRNVIKGALITVRYVLWKFSDTIFYLIILFVALCMHSVLTLRDGRASGEWRFSDRRVSETDGLFLRRSDIDQSSHRQMGCRMQEKGSELEPVRLRLEYARHGEDKAVGGNVSVSKCLVGSERVYNRGSSVPYTISRFIIRMKFRSDNHIYKIIIRHF